MKVNNSINGLTEVFGVIGDPIEHTLSPMIHNTMADMRGSNLVYTAFHVKPDDLGKAIAGAYALGIKGLNVTVPHKKEIIPFLSSVDKTAEAVGAVNTVKYTENGYVGYNTDMIGVYYALLGNGADVKDKSVLVLGAGGAANACAAMAAANGAKKVYIANRTLEKAQALAQHIKKYYNTDIEAMSMTDIYGIDSCDVVLNATTLGFGGNIGKTPIENADFFTDKGVEVVLDAIYSPWETKLLQDAASKGVKAVNGFDMLIYQAVAAREIWLEEKLDKDFRAELRGELLNYYLNSSNGSK
jgi:shikimate dehydrogenase